MKSKAFIERQRPSTTGNGVNQVNTTTMDTTSITGDHKSYHMY